jgi:Lon protease-like protein
MCRKERAVAGDVLEVPLFPLHVVLFPGMALPLHIFEPRYRRMTSDCLDSNLPIGIVLAAPGDKAGHEPPARVGTFARIIDYARLSDGRYNLLTIGTQRFRIVEEDHRSHLYLSGQVEPLEDRADEDERELTSLAAEARQTLLVYLHTVLTLLGNEDRNLSIPNDARDLSFLIATCLGCEDSQKQQLLETTSVAARLEAGMRGLREEIVALERQMQSDTGNTGNGGNENGNGEAQPPFGLN